MLYTFFCYLLSIPLVINKVSEKVRQRLLLLMALAVITLMASFFSHLASLAAALIFTLFLPGYVIVESCFKYLNIQEKLLLYPLLSVMVSTHLIYALSLILGYARLTIFTAFFIMLMFMFIPLTFTFSIRPSSIHPHPTRLSDLKGVYLSLGISLIAFIVLSNTVWVWDNGYIILSGSNWQDTPMHYEIIESINNGNFPPQMPYYAGVRMFYHYFVDFHTAILEKAYGAFFPRMIVVTNTFFIYLFALSIFVLASYLKNEEAGIYATLIGTLGGGLSFIGGLYALLHGQFAPTTNYAFQYGQFFTIPPIFDNLLQQRPQLIGLPALTTAAYFLYRGTQHTATSTAITYRRYRREIALSGLLTGLLFPFHILACFSAMLIFLLNWLNIKIKNRSISIRIRIEILALFLLFSIPPIMPYLITMLRSSSVSGISIGLGIKAPWIYYFLTGNPLLFYIANLGLPFILALLYLVKSEHRFFLYSWLFSLISLPNLFSFTPNPWDMYKFFHYAWIPVAVTAGSFLADLRSGLKSKLIPVLISVILIFSLLSSALIITWNLSTNYPAADVHEYEAGMWVRRNTPPKSVFLTWHSIHAPVSMIGGRLRVLGYVNWAYGHGFDIWERARDVERAYRGNISDTLAVMKKYNASYLYVGRAEMRNADAEVSKLERCKDLKEVYKDEDKHESGGIYIFALRHAPSSRR